MPCKTTYPVPGCWMVMVFATHTPSSIVLVVGSQIYDTHDAHTPHAVGCWGCPLAMGVQGVPPTPIPSSIMHAPCVHDMHSIAAALLYYHADG